MKGIGDVTAYEFSPKEEDAFVEIEYLIYLKKGILSGNYGPDNIYGEQPIFTVKESQTLDAPETSALFDQLNQQLSPADFLDWLIDYLKDPNSFKKEEVVLEPIKNNITHPDSLSLPEQPINFKWYYEEVKNKVFSKSSIPVVLILGVLAVYFNKEKLRVLFDSAFSRNKAKR